MPLIFSLPLSIMGFRADSLHSTLNARAPQHFYQTSPLRDIPFFDVSISWILGAISDFLQLMHQYFGLVDMSYIPNQVMKALTELETSNSAGNKAEIHFQLGLCHAVGFGVASDYEHAIRLISSAAEGGFWKARLLLRSVAAALGVTLDPRIEHPSLTSTNDNLERSSLDASRRLLTQSRSHGSVSMASERRLLKSNVTPISGDTSIMPLIAAIKLGQLSEIRALVQDCENVNLQLDDGETALHYAVLTLNSSIIAILVQAEADVLQCTTDDCELPIAGSAVYRIPSNVSPASLTVLLDRVDLLKSLLEPRFGQQSEPRKEETLVNLLAWGARYQSIDCVSYLCEQLGSKPERPFDDLGVNPLSYAVRAEFLFRIALFTPRIDRTNGDVTPVIGRQLEIVRKLLDAGFPLSADDSTNLNCLHVATATSHLAVLELLLEDGKISGSNALEDISPEGFSPLGISITRRRKDVYDVLMNAGSRHHNVWPEMRGDALHCCALYPSAESVLIAKEILKTNPKAINVRDSNWRTPLHCAALREHTEMIRTLIDARANIVARDVDGYTPLGAAVAWRSVRAIKQICAALERQHQPLISWTFTDTLFGTGLLTYSPLEQLLSPGTISPAREPEMLLEPNKLERFGCCDHPFSTKSLEVLRVLLECYTHKIRLNTNFFECIFFPKDSYSGMQPAIAMGNIKAVEVILGSGKFCFDYRYLVLYAHNQRAVGVSHIADEATREAMLDYLEDCHNDEWAKRRLERCSSAWLFFPWKLYYACYGNLEQREWKRASLWLRENRFHDYRPLLLEFVPWCRTRGSLDLVSFVIGWCFMAPMIAYLIKIHQVPGTEYPLNRKIYVIICLVMVSSGTQWIHEIGH